MEDQEEEFESLSHKRQLSSISEESEGSSTSVPLSKKLSLPHISELGISDDSTSTQETVLIRPTPKIMAAPSIPPLVDLHQDVKDIPGILVELHHLMLTSSHYTPRDKREILAQVPSFEAIPDMIDAIDDQNKAKQRVRNAAIAAKKQLVLYYMVGKHGWQTALNTLNKSVDRNFGMPDAKPVVKPQIFHTTTYASRSSQGRRAGSQFKPASRGSGGPPRR